MLGGFGNHQASEAIAGALPQGRNSPQHGPEQLSGTAFTAPRAENPRSWLYRTRPSAAHRPLRPFARHMLIQSGSFQDGPASPNRRRWDSLPLPEGPVDFVEWQTIIESMTILEWLAARWPTSALLPADPDEAAIVRSMKALIGCDIHPSNDLHILNMLWAEFAISPEQI